MEGIRETVISFLGLVLFAGVFEILLPDGNMKKYAALLMGFVVSAALVSLFGLAGDIDFEKIDADINVKYENIVSDREEKIQKEYIKNIVKIINQQGGSACDVQIDEKMRPVKVVLYAPINEKLKSFLVQELGVSEDSIVVR